MMMRNKFDHKGWILEKLHDPTILEHFDCGDDDLNEYYHKDAELHREQLLTQTYCFYPQSETWLSSFAFVDLCNDSVRLEKLSQETMSHIPEGKRYQFFPAVKVTRLGVDVKSKRNGIGSLLLETIKYFFLRDNRTGCRFVTVDAYNKPEVLHFYCERNDFEHLILNRSHKNERRQLPLIFDLKRMDG